MASTIPEPCGTSFEDFKRSLVPAARMPTCSSRPGQANRTRTPPTPSPGSWSWSAKSSTPAASHVLRQAALEAQTAAYSPDEPPVPEVDDSPFTPLEGPVRSGWRSSRPAASSSLTTVRWGRTRRPNEKRSP